MCETFSVGDLNLVSYSPHSTNTYICRMIIASMVCSSTEPVTKHLLISDFNPWNLKWSFLVPSKFRVCLNTAYFAENWKLITENTIAKYFLKCKTLFTHFCTLAGPWTVPWDQPKKGKRNSSARQTHTKNDYLYCLKYLKRNDFRLFFFFFFFWVKWF